MLRELADDITRPLYIIFYWRWGEVPDEKGNVSTHLQERQGGGIQKTTETTA